MEGTKSGRLYKTIVNLRMSLFFLFAGILINVFSRKAFLTYLGPDLVGLNATVSNLLGTLSVAEMGIFSAVTFFLYKPLRDKDEQTLNTIVSILALLYRKIGIGMIMAGILITLLIPFWRSDEVITWYYPYLTLWIMLFGSTVGYFFTYAIVLFFGEQRPYKATAIFEGGAKVKTLLQMVVVMLAKENPYLWWLVVELAYHLFLIVAIRWQIYRHYPWLAVKLSGVDTSSTLYKDLIKKIKQSFVYKMSSTVVTSASPLIVFFCLNLYSVTLYTNYLIISKMLTNINSMITNAVFAGLGNVVLEEDIEKEKRVTEAFIACMFFWASFISWGYYTFSSSLIEVLFGAEYMLSSQVVLLFSLVMFIMTARCGPETCLFSQGIIHDVWSPLAYTILYIVGTLCLGFKWGIAGVLTGILIAELFMFSWKPYFMSMNKSFVSYKKYLFRMMGYLVQTALAIYTYHLAAGVIPPVHFGVQGLNLLCEIALHAAIFLGVLVLTYSIGSAAFRHIIFRCGKLLF